MIVPPCAVSGSTPYPDMTAREVMRNVHNGYRLERPSHCRSELFRVISRCWHADPDRRPEFQTLRRDLAQLLEDNMNGHYVDLESFASECTDWCIGRPKETEAAIRFSTVSSTSREIDSRVVARVVSHKACCGISLHNLIPENDFISQEMIRIVFWWEICMKWMNCRRFGTSCIFVVDALALL